MDPVWESGAPSSAASAWAPALRRLCHLPRVGQGRHPRRREKAILRSPACGGHTRSRERGFSAGVQGCGSHSLRSTERHTDSACGRTTLAGRRSEAAGKPRLSARPASRARTPCRSPLPRGVYLRAAALSNAARVGRPPSPLACEKRVSPALSSYMKVIDQPTIAVEILNELPLTARRLVAEEEKLFLEVDRMQGEIDFRFTLFLPLAITTIVVALGLALPTLGVSFACVYRSRRRGGAAN
jgi:hypothetical protein